MSSQTQDALKRALGARILSEANDLKRTPEALAHDIGFTRDLVAGVIAGTESVETARDVMHRMVEVYPINLADLWVEADDTDAGVKVMRGAESKASSRIFDRKDRNGDLTPYYEYRDTAMSRLGPFKPEWIQPVRVMQNADPDNPDVAYNHGHLLHQMTFFIGPVNFYWECGGKRHCAELQTGDSNYITPFVPHSFASRTEDELGLIIAVTFAGSVRRALDDFSLIGGADSDMLAGDLRQAEKAFAARLNRHLANETLTEDGFCRLLTAEGIAAGRAGDLASGAVIPNAEEIGIMAAILSVRVQDLMTTALDADEEVVVKQDTGTGWRPWPDGNTPTIRLNPLARTRHQPALKGFHVEAVSDQDGGSDADMRHGLFEYIYNYGTKAIRLHWAEGREAILEPGDSACVRPMVAHRFSLPQGESDPARFFLVRVPGQLDDTALDEYARFAAEGRNRVAQETKRWF